MEAATNTTDTGKMSGGEIAGIVVGALVVLIIIYEAMQPPPAPAPVVIGNPNGLGADGSNPAYPNIGTMAQYALNQIDLQASNNLMAFMMAAPGYASDGNGGTGWAAWWLPNLPLYLPGGERDNATYFPQASFINGKLYLMTRLCRAAVDVMGEPSLKNTNIAVTVFNMQQAFNAQEATGL